jgi:hypothetical protein
MTVKTVSTLVNCNKYIIVKCSLVEVDQHFRRAYCLHTLTIGTVGITEMSVYFETVERYSPEGCQLDTRRRQNPKSHIYFILLTYTRSYARCFETPEKYVPKSKRPLFTFTQNNCWIILCILISRILESTRYDTSYWTKKKKKQIRILNFKRFKNMSYY